MKTDLVVAGYIFHENKLLLIHHAKTNLWLPVGGHIDPNETPDEALIREIKEEVNVEVSLHTQSDIPVSGATIKNLATPFYVNIHDVGDHHHCCFFYICKLLSKPELKLEEGKILDAKWLTKEEVKNSKAPQDVIDIGLKAFELL